MQSLSGNEHIAIVFFEICSTCSPRAITMSVGRSLRRSVGRFVGGRSVASSVGRSLRQSVGRFVRSLDKVSLDESHIPKDERISM